MISLTPDEVERRFRLLGLLNRCSELDKRMTATTTIFPEEPDVLALPVPNENVGLNILNLRRLLGTDPSRPPSFFDHPWYLEEQFATEDCSAGWHFVYTNVLSESLSQPFDYADSLRSRGLELASAVEVVL